MSPPDPQLVTVADGRRLEVLLDGPADGVPLLFHNGTPFGVVAFPALSRAAAAHGLRLVAWSRPGYGRSSPTSGRRVVDVAGDAGAVLDHLGAGRALTLGWSGGGPHALACAAVLPERIRAGAVVGGVAPSGAPGLDWQAGMGPENLEEFAAAATDEATLRSFLEQAAVSLGHVTGAEVAAELGGLVDHVDRVAITGELADWLAASMRHAVASGIEGWLGDDLAFLSEWGFDPAAISVPVAVWQGRHDLMVPYAHGEWLAAHLPSAHPRLFEDEGHLSLFTQLDRIVADLVELSGLDINPH